MSINSVGKREQQLLDITCAICLEIVSPDGTDTFIRAPPSSPCCHVLHRSCAMMYLASADSSGHSQNRCPVCRQTWEHDGLLEVGSNGHVLRHFWPVSRGKESASSSAALPCVAAPPTRNTPGKVAAAVTPQGSASSSSSSATEEMRIRKDYIRPRRGELRARTASPQLQKCPLTGAMVPVEEASKHVQAVLRNRAAASNLSALRSHVKQNTSAANDARISLIGFALQRPDLCGTTTEEMATLSAASSGRGSQAQGGMVGKRGLFLPSALDSKRLRLT